MRFERLDGAPNLQELFRMLVIEHLRGRVLDDDHAKESAQGQFPDFACFRDILLIEMKNLEAEQDERINNIFEEKVKEEERPFFYGVRNGDFVINSVSNGREIKAEIASKLARTIETILRKANRQFNSYRNRHRRKNTVSVCVILNAYLMEYTHDLMMKMIYRKSKDKTNGRNRYSDIDFIIYISEKHIQLLENGRAAFALSVYECPSGLSEPWKSQFIDRIIAAWSFVRTGHSIVEQTKSSEFDIVHDIQSSMKRHEIWSLEYHRNPYLSNLSAEHLRIVFVRAVAVLSLTFLKGGWQKPRAEDTEEAMRTCQHIIEETNRRGIDLRELNGDLLGSEEFKLVYGDLPPDLTMILTGRHA